MTNHSLQGFGLPKSHRFQVKIDGPMSRIMFGDVVVRKQADNRISIVMKTDELEQLRDLISQLLAEAKTQK